MTISVPTRYKLRLEEIEKFLGTHINISALASRAMKQECKRLNALLPEDQRKVVLKPPKPISKPKKPKKIKQKKIKTLNKVTGKVIMPTKKIYRNGKKVGEIIKGKKVYFK